MSRLIVMIAAAALAAGAYAQKPADAPAKDAKTAESKSEPNGNVAVVNGQPIKQSRLEAVLRQIKQPDSPQLRSQIKDKLIEMEILTQEAKKRKITEREDVQFQLDNARATIIIQSLLRDEIQAHQPTDEQIQKEYDKQKAAVDGKEYKVRHILVDTEEEAKGIIAKLDKGAKFEDLAKGTKDTVSAAKGGEMDWAGPGAYVKPFSDAMVKLEKGKYTAEPVQSQFGWHVIRLDDVRSVDFPPLDKIKQKLVDQLEQERAKAFIESLKKSATIK